MKLLERFKQDKLSLLFLLIILILGIFIRVYEFSEVEYWNDDMSAIPTGLLGFYQYPIYPGLSAQGEPILGNLFIGGGCLLSGEDFSKVSEVKPNFFPGREILIGKQLIKAFPYCHLPIYIFGILFFLTISFLALDMLPKYSAIFTISFYAFYPSLLQLSRWIKVDVIGYFFVVLALLFLWKGYNYEKDKKEILFFILSFAFFGLAFSTKLPNGAFLVFGLFILINKYKKEVVQLIRKIGLKLELDILQKIELEEVNPSRPIKIAFYSLVAYLITFLAPFYFNPKNFFDVVNQYQLQNPERSGITFNNLFFPDIFNFLITINTIDLVLFILSFIVLVKLIRNKKDNKEKFIFYLFLFLILTLVFSKALTYLRVFITFSIGLIFLISLLFSDGDYSLFKVFKIKNKRLVFSLFILIYMIFSFTVALSDSPYFVHHNPIPCKFAPEDCRFDRMGFVQREIADYLSGVLADNETFYWPRYDVIFYYIRHEEGIQKFLFEQSFSQRFDRFPTPQEEIKFFHPDNRIIRYIIIDGDEQLNEDNFIIMLRNEYIPNKIIYSNKIVAARIYDLENLSKRN